MRQSDRYNPPWERYTRVIMTDKMGIVKRNLENFASSLSEKEPSAQFRLVFSIFVGQND
jgi:hypothetical protein